MPRPPPDASGFFSQLPSRGSPRGVGAHGRAGDAVACQNVCDLERDHGPRGAVARRHPRERAGARSFRPTPDDSRTRRCKTRAKERVDSASSPNWRAAWRGSMRSTTTNRGEVAIGEIIGAARTKTAPDRRERGGAGARAQDQQVMRQAIAKKMPRQADGCLSRRARMNERRAPIEGRGSPGKECRQLTPSRSSRRSS